MYCYIKELNIYIYYLVFLGIEFLAKSVSECWLRSTEKKCHSCIKKMCVTVVHFILFETFLLNYENVSIFLAPSGCEE